MSNYVFKSEDIATGAPGYVAPLSVDFSPDGKLLTYLYPDANGPRKVFAVDLTQPLDEGSFKLFDTAASGGLSLQEQLRRERMRLFTQGIASYEWSSKPKNGQTATQKLIVPLGGKVIMYEDSATAADASEKCRIIYDGSAGDAVDPHLSPDGTAVAFVINDDLYAMKVPGAAETEAVAPTRLTFNGAKEGVTCGLADYLAQEEMDRYRGFWWSPDSSMIVYAEADETVVPKYDILHLGKDDPTHSETHRYPFAGKVNPQVTLAVAKVNFATPAATVTSTDSTAEHVWLDLFDRSHPAFTTVAQLSDPASQDATSPGDYYIARVGWWEDGSVMVQVQNRAQSLLQLLRLDPATGARTVVLEEKSDIWINLYHMLHCFDSDFVLPGAGAGQKGDFYFLWASERTGFAQLYLYRYDAVLGKGVCVSGPIGGGGEFVVESIDAVDTESHTVYFSGNRGNACERHSYVASYLPDKAAVSALALTTTPGWHTVTINLAQSIVADVYSSITSPLNMKLYRLDKATGTLSLLTTVTDSATDDARLSKPFYRASLVTPVLHTIRSTDGKVDLHCAIYLPQGVTFDPATGVQGAAPSAAIMSVYGGPHVQRVHNNWMLTADLRAQCLAQQGFVVIKCDNRGSFRRGIAFEGALHRDMGNIEIQDQNCAVAYFAQRGLIDAARVGMFGWSYGGYMSAMAVCRSPPNTYACAVAGAPVTSWDGYDTHYTERYMGTPQNNAAGYDASSVMTHVPTMSGKLMLVHGLIDENVHFRHTARLINTLISARKRYELVLFPCERHSPHKLQDKIYIEDIMHDFFVSNLHPKKVSEIPGAAGVAGGAVATANAGAAPKMMASL